MDTQTLIAVNQFGRARLLAILDTIEQSGQDVQKVLAWRPGPGRAHIGWQAMHCAATHDRYLHLRLLGQPVVDAALCDQFGGGSTPSDDNVPTMTQIRAALEKHWKPLEAFIQSATPEKLAEVQTPPNGPSRSVGESLVLIAWHEAHHQGQIHLTWNCFKAAHGNK